MHQGSALSPLLFVMDMEALSREFTVALPWELLYADDLVVIAKTEEDLIKRLNEWKDIVEYRGMRVNTNKTMVMISGEWQKVMQKFTKLALHTTTSTTTTILWLSEFCPGCTGEPAPEM